LAVSLVLILCPARAHNIDSKADIHPTAVLMGNVTVGPYTKIGPKAVIQGNVTIGHHTQVMGNAVISASADDRLVIGNYVRIDYGAVVVSGRPAVPTMTANQAPDTLSIGNDCWIGMNATVRGAQMEDGSAVGNDAVADFNTCLGKGAVLAHGAVAPYDMVIPAGALAEGNPAKITKNGLTDADRQRIFGLIPAQWIHYEQDNLAKEIDKNPPRVQQSYPGIDGRPFWGSNVKVDPTAEVHPTAILSNGVTVGPHTRIGPYVVITGGAKIGHHCDLRAGMDIHTGLPIGNYVFLGERVHIGSSRTGGFDSPLWIKDGVYVSPNAVVHATKVDAGVYYGANATSDYGDHIAEGAILKSGSVVLHDTGIRAEAVVEGNPYLMDRNAGIPDQRRMALLGFLPNKWLTEVMAPELERAETYEAPLSNWEHTNRGTVKGKVNPSAILVGNVNVEGATIEAGCYLEGTITIGEAALLRDQTMVISKGLQIGEHTHIYDKVIIVDGRPALTGSTTNTVADQAHVGMFCWINHNVALQGAWLDDFANTNIGTSAAFGTRVGREALLLNGSATYADQQLPPRSISWGDPAKVRVLDSTMHERMSFFYGRDWPTWERQADPEELKKHKLPE
jgi:carbonic anhydrase/acetyltransferase-like protein (isoleucine patch superfamily)